MVANTSIDPSFSLKILPWAAVYDESTEIFSLHAHLHLASQVRLQGGLAFTSAFCFESCIRSIKKKVHGTRDLATQIGYWCDFETLLSLPTICIESVECVDKINLTNTRLDHHRDELIANIHRLGQKESDSFSFLRYKRPFFTFPSFVYDYSFHCASYVIPYYCNDKSILFGNLIVFIKLKFQFYTFIQQYDITDVNVSAFDDTPDTYRMKLIDMFPLVRLSDEYSIIPVVLLRRKCVSVHLSGYVCLSEVNVDYEHD